MVFAAIAGVLGIAVLTFVLAVFFGVLVAPLARFEAVDLRGETILEKDLVCLTFPGRWRLYHNGIAILTDRRLIWSPPTKGLWRLVLFPALFARKQPLYIELREIEKVRLGAFYEGRMYARPLLVEAAEESYAFNFIIRPSDWFGVARASRFVDAITTARSAA